MSESADSHLGRPVRREMVESGSDSATVVAAESEAQLIHQDLMVFQPFQTLLPLLAHNRADNPVSESSEVSVRVAVAMWHLALHPTDHQ